MTLLDAAQRKKNWRVSLRQGDGTPLPAGSLFLFSGGPSGLSRLAGEACFAQITRQSGAPLTLELHHGLQHLGRSGARHEWDVALLPQVITNSIRAGNGRYPRGLPFLGVECKDKTKNGDTNEMRQTLARMFDLAHVSQRAFPISKRLMSENCSVGIGRRWPTYVANFSKGYFGIVRIGGFQLGANRLSDHYSINRVGQITTSSVVTRTTLQAAMSQTLDQIDQLY
jgi:hypothetical protein